jgi:glycyl-tRNA synthetase alpha chain
MTALTFQEIIMRLDAYWAAQGCLVVQPYDVEVGAGTAAPSTFLRVLGPEPWSVAYPQPSRRPADGRYAENPNRYQHYFQYQVILKPTPADPLGLYLGSLAALGVSQSDHDVRFVEDNWEAPSLGSWGLGWEVWLDGLEVTQWTYFQQLGGFEVELVPAEITYGLDRLALFVQDKASVFDLEWAPGVTWGEVYREAERQWSAYNYEEAPVEVLTRRLAEHLEEGRRLVERRLPLPAYDQVLKASHALNLLDARGALSVTERADYILRIRNLARAVAQLYLEMESGAQAAA